MAEPGSSVETNRRSAEPDPAVAELVARAQRGDALAFERLYRLHVGRVHALCLRLIAEPVQAEGLTQDVFVRAWEKLATYSGRGAFGAWLHRLAVNVVIENRRAHARYARWFDPGSEASAMEPGGSGGRGRSPGAATRAGAATAPPQVDLAIALERAIATLPPGARLAFVLHDMCGYRHREIAAMSGVATGTIKAQLHRARKLLREALGDSWKAGDR